MEIEIDGIKYEKGSDAHLARLDSKHTEAIAAETARADKAEGALSVASQEPDVARLDELAAERAEVLTRARALRGDSLETAGKSNAAIIAEVLGDAVDVARSDEYKRGVFDAMALPNKTTAARAKTVAVEKTDAADTVDHRAAFYAATAARVRN